MIVNNAFSQKHKLNLNLSYSFIGIITDFRGQSLYTQYERSISNNFSGYLGVGIGIGHNPFIVSDTQADLRRTFIYHEWQEYVQPGWFQSIIEVERGSVIRTPSLSHYTEFYQDLGVRWNGHIGKIDISFAGGISTISVTSHFSIEASSGEIRLIGMSEPVRIWHNTPTYVSYWDWGNTMSLGLSYPLSDRIDIGPDVTWRGYYKSLHNFYVGLNLGIAF